MNGTAMAASVEPIGRFPAAVAEQGIIQHQPYCLITGASRGLGLALAEECALLGMNLILVALPETGLPEVSDNLAQTYGIDVECREIDLTEADSPKTLYRWITEEGLAINMLINNAGVGAHGPFSESALEHNRAMIDLNISALVHLTQLFLPELQRRQRAYILIGRRDFPPPAAILKMGQIWLRSDVEAWILEKRPHLVEVDEEL